MAKIPKLVDDEEEEEEGSGEIGPCKNCQFYDVDRDEEDPSDDTLSRCIHPDLEEYELRVSGDSGCNLFEPYEDDDEDDDDDLEDEEEAEEEY